jgi:hypothetical protein
MAKKVETAVAWASSSSKGGGAKAGAYVKSTSNSSVAISKPSKNNSSMVYVK